MRVQPPIALLAGLLVTLLAACGGDGGDGGAPGDPTPDPAAPVIVSFLVADEESYRVLLTEPADIAGAWALAGGQDVPSIPNGLVVRGGEPGVNTDYSWEIDADDFEWADVTTEVCDGLPSDVEAGVVTSDRYCPWSAVVTAVEPAP